MKSKILTLIASVAASAMASAFTIDFNNLTVSDGTTTTAFTISNVEAGSPQTVTVPGYGDVTFQVGPASDDVLVVGSTYRNDSDTIQQSLELGPPEFVDDSSEVVIVTFLGLEALSVDFDIIGVGSGENPNPVRTAFNEYQYDPNSNGSGTSGDGAGIAAISWTTVPEPSSSLLVMIGAGTLLLRRRR
ncbi:hypothetical protein NT6N_13840 [Oceaniferula spumae]|uniref:PEP-CTERM protein-sorting domain-containing protein n=1 Tax=Oceaniferula spumae TaxID=2979115 RepID=A0AAT9FK37_9BACT